MKDLAGLLTHPLSRTIALALVHFLWQGASVALVLWAADGLLSRSSARARYAAACAALAMMLILPAVTVWRLRARPAATVLAMDAVSQSPRPAAPNPYRDALGSVREGRFARVAPWIVLGWLAGVCSLSIRFLGGFAAARRLKHRGTRGVAAAWETRLAELASRLRVACPVRLLESVWVEVPTAVGILRPVILLPAGIATGMPSEQLDSLLAHELAHIRRSDCLMSVFQALAETLLFYHPAVWWVSARIRVERENACDDLAVAVTGNVAAYARALVDLEERRDRTPRLAVAASGGRLWNRIIRLVPASGPSPSRSPRWLAAAIALGGVLALGAAAMVPTVDGGERVEKTAVRRSQDKAPTPSAADAKPAEGAKRPRSTDSPSSPAPGPRSGLLTPQELIAFRIHGVTPEFIGEIVALGYTKASPDQLVALRIHGVTPEYISEMTGIFGKLPLERYTEFRIHGLSSDSARALEATFGRLSPDEAMSMRIHGVDAAFAKAFRDAGYSSMSADEAVSLRIHGVNPADGAAWKGLGFGTPSIDDLLSLRIHGATPEFAAAMRSQGLSDLSLDDLVAFRIHGVTPEFVREIRALGYASLSADDFTAFRIHGVSPETIREMNRRAGQNLSAEELIDSRIHGRRTREEEREEP